MSDPNASLVRKEFYFTKEMLSWKATPDWAKLVLQFQKGDVLDVGCATCQLVVFMRKSGWHGSYYGIDIQRYAGFEYPADINLTIGDATEMEFPRADTVVLCNILEHVDDPISLLRKALRASKQNVIVNVPKRNEELWKHGIVEFHQLDKTHKHCGFSKEELLELVESSGGKIRVLKDVGGVNGLLILRSWTSPFPRAITRLFELIVQHIVGRIFSSETFYTEMWCEIVKSPGD